MSNAIRVAVIDRQGFYIDAIVNVLEQQPDIEVVASATIFEDFVEHLDDAEVVVLQQEPIDLTKELIDLIFSECPDAQVIVLGAADDEDALISFVERGAIGYVRESEEFDQLLNVIRVVQHGQALAHPELIAPLYRRLAEIWRAWRELSPAVDGEVTLTARQNEVMCLIAKGHSNAEIAEELSISIGTVKNHVHKIFGQLGVRSREQAATVYARFEADGNR